MYRMQLQMLLKMTLAPKFVCKPWQEGSKGKKILIRKM